MRKYLLLRFFQSETLDVFDAIRCLDRVNLSTSSRACDWSKIAGSGKNASVLRRQNATHATRKPGICGTRCDLDPLNEVETRGALLSLGREREQCARGNRSATLAQRFVEQERGGDRNVE